MLPEICHLGFFTVYSYGLMLVLAFFVCTYLASLEAKKEGLDPEAVFNLCFFIFIFGIIGARVFYVFYDFGFYLRHPLEIIMLQHGGMAWFGGLIFGSAAAIVFLKKNKLGLFKMLDLLVPFVALAQSIGRIGCLLNGCCYGRPSEFGLYFKNIGQVLIPTQLYSSLLLILIFFILRFIQNRKHALGEVLCAYLFLYSLKRFFIEFFRNDSPKMFYGLTLFQILCLLTLSISTVLFIKILRNKKR